MFWRFTETLEAVRLCTHHTHTHTRPPPLLSSPLLPMGPEASTTHQGPKLLPTNKIIANIILMSQNYIKSLNVDERAWQTISFHRQAAKVFGGSLTHLGKENTRDISEPLRRCCTRSSSFQVICSLHSLIDSFGTKRHRFQRDCALGELAWVT